MARQVPKKRLMNPDWMRGDDLEELNVRGGGERRSPMEGQREKEAWAVKRQIAADEPIKVKDVTRDLENCNVRNSNDSRLWIRENDVPV